jgi:hypothetical protein
MGGAVVSALVRLAGVGRLWRRLRWRRRVLASTVGERQAPLRSTTYGTRYVYPSPAPSWQEMLGE